MVYISELNFDSEFLPWLLCLCVLNAARLAVKLTKFWSTAVLCNLEILMHYFTRVPIFVHTYNSIVITALKAVTSLWNVTRVPPFVYIRVSTPWFLFEIFYHCRCASVVRRNQDCVISVVCLTLCFHSWFLFSFF